MLALDEFRKLALSFPDSSEEPHFEKPSFRVKKKIFATYNTLHHRVCIKLSEIDQDVFCSFDKNIIYPVPNKWGKQGWTLIDLNQVPHELLIDALTTSYCEVAPKYLSEIIRPFDFDKIVD